MGGARTPQPAKGGGGPVRGGGAARAAQARGPVGGGGPQSGAASQLEAQRQQRSPSAQGGAKDDSGDLRRYSKPGKFVKEFSWTRKWTWAQAKDFLQSEHSDQYENLLKSHAPNALGRTEAEQTLTQLFAGRKLKGTYTLFKTSRTDRDDRARVADATGGDSDQVGGVVWEQSERSAARVQKGSAERQKLLEMIGTEQYVNDDPAKAYRVGVAVTIHLPPPSKARGDKAQRLARHGLMQVIAKGACDAGKWTQREKDLGLPEVYNLEFLTHLAVGFRAAFIWAKDDADEPPVLAFEGTHDVYDLLTDLDPAGVGVTQFIAMRKKIKETLQFASQQTGRGILLTGHSLGGALAQLTAAQFSGQFKFADVVTFQAPGITKTWLDFYEATTKGKDRPDVTHYTQAGDPVAHAGEAALPGTNRRVRTQSLVDAADVAGLHTTEPIEADKSGRFKESGKPEVAEEGTHFSDPDRKHIEALKKKVDALVAYLMKRLGVKDPPKEFDQLSGWPKYAEVDRLLVSALDVGSIVPELSEKAREVLRGVDDIQDDTLRDVLQRQIRPFLRLLDHHIHDWFGERLNLRV